MDTSKLDDTVNQILQDAVAKAAQGAEFLKDQVPDLVQQLLHWKLAESLLSALFIGLGIIAFLLIAKFIWRKAGEEPGSDWYFGATMFTVLGGFASCVSLIFLAGCLLESVEILVAPKVWLLEYAAHLVRR